MLFLNMFESDDFDQVLSQFDFPDLPPKTSTLINANKIISNQNLIEPQVSVQNSDSTNALSIPCSSDIVILTTASKSNLSNSASILNPIKNVTNKKKTIYYQAPVTKINSTNIIPCNSDIPKAPIATNFNELRPSNIGNQLSPKHTKRKVINSLFDQNSKRKFPGPAGLLSGNLDESKDDSLGQMEFLSQDIDFTQNHHQRHLFESSIWNRLHNDVQDWNFGSIDSIKCIKEQALEGNLRRRKANVVTAFIEMVDRSAVDPFISLRDLTGNIKATLHRDAWSQFSPYIASQYCALVLWKPTILTTGGTFKKHYLNITLSNIWAIYSSAILNNDVEINLDGYQKICEDEFTIIVSQSKPVICEDEFTNLPQSKPVEPDLQHNTSNQNDGTCDLLEGLDSSIFLEDVF